MWKEAVVAWFEHLLQHLPGGTENSFENSQLQLLSWLRLEPGTFQMWVMVLFIQSCFLVLNSTLRKVATYIAFCVLTCAPQFVFYLLTWIWHVITGFWHNRSITDHIFCICQILEKKWEYNKVVHHLFIDFKKAYDSVRKEVLYNILIEFGIPMELVRLIKMCLTETYNRVRVGKYLTFFYIRSGLKQGDALLSLLFNFVL